MGVEYLSKLATSSSDTSDLLVHPIILRITSLPSVRHYLSLDRRGGPCLEFLRQQEKLRYRYQRGI